MSQGSPVRRRHLVSQLKHLRVQSGLSQSEVSKRMGWESGKIIRIETGKFVRLNSADVSELCRLYGASDELREELVEIAKASRGKKPWWFQYKDVVVSAFYGLEHEATKIQEYCLGLIPGLLQHPEYVTVLMRRGFLQDKEEQDRRIEVRFQRHKNVLERDAPPQLWIVLDESCLRCTVGGPKLMERQMRHLLDLAARPTIDIQVLPHAAGRSQSYGFSILTFNEDDRVVYVDIPPNGIFYEDGEDLAEHDRVFDYLQSAALSPAESQEFISKLADEYARGHDA